MTKAVYAGSFDPITNGHLWMIDQGARLFNEFVVAIGINPDKKSTFSLEDRLAMLKEATKNIPNAEISSFESKYLVNYANSIGAGYILRGIRNQADYEYERTMRHINSDFNNEITTAFLMPPREISEVSSSFVKGLIGPEGWEFAIERYIPRIVYNKLLTKFKGFHPRWQELANDERAYEKLLIMYNEPHRHYHNFAHIANAMKEFKLYQESEKQLKNPIAVEFAIWFHDAIYDPKSDNNEEKSALLVQQMALMLESSKEFAEYVGDLVLATKHSSIPENTDAQALVDIDLSILGKTEKEFDEYEAEIREEYSWVPEENFKSRRKSILEGFLKRQTIYSTNFFRDRYEAQARNNLKRSISRL